MLKIKSKPKFGVKEIILIALCALLVTADLLTKHFEEADSWYFVIIPGWLQIVGGVRNQGCAFSFLNDKPEIGQPVLITLTCIMIIFLVLLFLFLQDRNLILKIAVVTVIAGAVGNLVDRFMLRQVRDFIGLNMLFNGQLVYCNLADFFIVAGAVLAIVDLMFLNEWAVFPLTRRAKQAQAKRREDDAAEKAEKSNSAEIPATETSVAKTEPSADDTEISAAATEISAVENKTSADTQTGNE